MRILRFLYTLLFTLALPILMLRLLWRSRKNSQYRRRIYERLGLVKRQKVAAIWVHAVSVGESIAAAPLVRALKRQYPDKTIVMTTTTPTGSAQVKRLLGDEVLHYYMPYDIPFCVKQFLIRLNIDSLIIMETEIWPNVLFTCNKMKVSVILANARLSARSAKNYAKLGGVMSRLLACYSLVIGRGQADLNHFLQLGLGKDKCVLGGNIKYDLSISEDVIAQGLKIRKMFGSRPVWVAASTHDNEEEQLLDVQLNVLQAFPDALLVIVPRHPERFDNVASLCRNNGFVVARRSGDEQVTAQTQVYLADTMGELLALYVACDVVFMGGSLVTVGGHNLLEPAALQKPLITGQHLHNFKEVSQLLLAADALKVVKNINELSEYLTIVLRSQTLRETQGRNAYEVVDKNKGSVQNHIRYISTVIK